MSRDDDNLPVTSYAILGLLAMRPWTTYELTQQMGRSLSRFYPRAKSQTYEAPKRLEKLGLARSTEEFTGKRKSTVYSITPKGRRALKRWLDRPGDGPQLECELLLQLWLSENGTKESTVATVRAIKQWADARNEENIAFAREYLESGGPFPDRLAQIVIVGRFLTDFADMVGAWSEWAEEIVAAWPQDVSKAAPDVATLEAVAARGN